MTREDIIRLAREMNMHELAWDGRLHEFAALVAAHSLDAQEQEPVAYFHPDKGFYWARPTKVDAPTVVDVPPLPLYAAPPTRKAATVREIGEAHELASGKIGAGFYEGFRAAERHHNIKQEDET